MNKALLFGFLTIVLFAVSASLSWFLLGPKINPLDLTSTPTISTPKLAEHKKATSPPEPLPSVTSVTLPRSVARAPYTAGTDDAVQLAASLRERLSAQREKEDKFVAQQKSLELVYQDIRGERGAIDELRKQVTEELK